MMSSNTTVGDRLTQAVNLGAFICQRGPERADFGLQIGGAVAFQTQCVGQLGVQVSQFVVLPEKTEKFQ